MITAQLACYITRISNFPCFCISPEHHFAFVWPWDRFHAIVSLIFTVYFGLFTACMSRRTHDLFHWNEAILTHSVQFSSLQAQLNWNGFQVRLCSRCLPDIAWHSGKKIMRSHYELSPVLIRALSPDTSASLLQDKNSLLSSVLVWLQVVQWFPASLDLHQQSLWRHEKS